MDYSFRYISLSLAFAAFCGLYRAAYAESATNNVLELSSQTNVARKANITATGIALRTQLREIFLTLQSENKISDNPSKAVEVSYAVLHYIPLGTSFEVAEDILKVAGFNIYPPIVKDLKSYQSRDVVAINSSFGQSLDGHTDLYINLQPTPDGRYDKIFGISAKFIGAHL